MSGGGDSHDGEGTDDDFNVKVITNGDDNNREITADVGLVVTSNNVDDGADNNSVVVEEDTSGVPIDRGYAFVIVAACFGMHILVVGGLKSFGVLFVEIQDQYDVTARELGVAQGITMTLMMGLSFVANILSSRFTARQVVFVGGILSGAGFLLTAFMPSYNWIYVTYCLVSGIGFALSYAPCVVMVGCHFRKYRSIANGIAVSGSGIGSFVLPNLIRFLLNQYGLFGCLLILGGLMMNICVFALLIRPLSSYAASSNKRRKVLSSDVDLFENNVDVDVLVPTKQINGRHPSLQSENNVGNPNNNKPSHSDNISDSLYMQKLPNEMESSSKLIPCGSKDSLRHRAVSETSTSIADAPEEAGRDAARWRQGSNGDVMIASLQSIPRSEAGVKVSRTWRTVKNVMCCRRGSDSPSDPQLFEWSLLKNPVFLVYALSCFFANLGYPNVFIMLPPHVESLGFSRDKAALLMSVIGLSDLAGRVLFGLISDSGLFPKRYGFIGAMASSGILLLVVPTLTSVTGLVVYAILYGFVAGAYIALVAVMLADSLGPEKLGSSFGLTALAMALSLVVGPPICGALRDSTGSWKSSFVMAGVCTLVGSTFPLLEPLARRRLEASEKAAKDIQC